MKVMKFGGGCLRDGDHFLKIVEIIGSQKTQTVVVISAIFGITSLIADGITKALESEKKVPIIIQTIRDIHRSIAKESINDNVLRKKTLKNVEVRIKRLERLLYGVAYTKEITDSLRAFVLSYGERLSVLVLSGVLESKNIKASPLDADEIGMITDKSFENATALLQEVKNNLTRSVLPLVHKGTIPVITGYFGSTHEGRVTTFGRNGSDYSASVIAYGMNANQLEIWKDVDGFMSADPKIVNNAHRIERLSYYEAAELSYFGAKILHPRTVEPLVDRKIPIYIKNFYQPEGRGTKVLSGSYKREDVVKSVTYNRQVSVLRIHGPGVGYKPGIIAEIGHALSNMGINIYSVITSQTCINLLLDKDDSRRSYDSLKKEEGGVIEKVDLEDNIALIAVVGEGLKKTKGVAARVFSAVAEENINVEMISSGASEVAYYFIVSEIDVEKAVNSIHREFF